MKKIFLITPLALFFSMLSFNADLEAAGCKSHKNKNVKVECSISNENCDDNKVENKFNKVDV